MTAGSKLTFFAGFRRVDFRVRVVKAETVDDGGFDDDGSSVVDPDAPPCSGQDINDDENSPSVVDELLPEGSVGFYKRRIMDGAIRRKDLHVDPQRSLGDDAQHDSCTRLSKNNHRSMIIVRRCTNKHSPVPPPPYFSRFDDHRVIVVVNGGENTGFGLWAILLGLVLVVDDQSAAVETLLNVFGVVQPDPQVVHEQEDRRARGEKRDAHDDPEGEAREFAGHVLEDVQPERVTIEDENVKELLRFQLEVLRLNLDVVGAGCDRCVAQPERMVRADVEEIVFAETQVNERVVADVVVANDDVGDELCRRIVGIETLRGMRGREDVTNFVGVRPEKDREIVVDISRTRGVSDQRTTARDLLDFDSHESRADGGIVRGENGEIVLIVHFSVEGDLRPDVALLVDGEQVLMIVQRVTDAVAVVLIDGVHVSNEQSRLVGGVLVQGEEVEIFLEHRRMLVLIEHIHLHVGERLQRRLARIASVNPELILALDFVIERPVDQNRSIGRRDAEFGR